MAPRSERRQKAPTSSKPIKPPQPFMPASERVAALLTTLNKTQIYIVHIDALPAVHKRRIFCIPLALNGSILALVLWRAYAALPTYLSLLWAALGQQTSATVDTRRASWLSLIGTLLKRCLLIVVDFVIFRIVGNWPYTFFLERPENPCTWRWKLGFRDREIVVRVSRNWGAEELFHGSKTGDQSPFWTTRVAPFITPAFVREKTGYLMMSKDWDLDLDTAVKGQRLIDDGVVDADQVDGLVLGFWQDQWLAWNFREAHGLGSRGQGQGADSDSGEKQMQMLRAELAAMGKEDLFFRMIELVQYEASTPEASGGFSTERKQTTLDRIKKLFADNDTNFEQILNDLNIDLPKL